MIRRSKAIVDKDVLQWSEVIPIKLFLLFMARPGKMATLQAEKCGGLQPLQPRKRH